MKKYRRKKYRNNIVESMTPTLAMGFAGAGMGVMGGAVAPILPAGMDNPFTPSGEIFGGAARITAPIGAGGFVLNQMRGLEKKVKRKKRKSFF